MSKKKLAKQKANVDDVDEISPPSKGINRDIVGSSTEKDHSSDEKFNKPKGGNTKKPTRKTKGQVSDDK